MESTAFIIVETREWAVGERNEWSWLLRLKRWLVGATATPWNQNHDSQRTSGPVPFKVHINAPSTCWQRSDWAGRLTVTPWSVTESPHVQTLLWPPTHWAQRTSTLSLPIQLQLRSTVTCHPSKSSKLPQPIENPGREKFWGCPSIVNVHSSASFHFRRALHETEFIL